MCYRPIKIYNRSRILSSLHSERYVQYVPCGHCVDCQKKLSNEWYYRAFNEFQDCVNNNGYVLFDTLTYDNEHLPRSFGYPVFRYQDVRLFLVRLRTNLSRAGYDIDGNLRYFLTSEYGTKPSDGVTYRPHYHVLFYVLFDINPLELSRYIDDAWQKGRTDGVNYKGNRYVLDKRVFRKGVSQSVFVCKYVSKYVQKSSVFSSEIQKRINKVMFNKYIVEHASFLPDKNAGYNTHYLRFKVDNIDDYYRWLNTSCAKQYKRKLSKIFGQFHLQSEGFGASILGDIDLIELFNTGSLYIPDNNKVVMRIPLPTYYKRKLFYKQLKVDGIKYWCPTELGKQYNNRSLVRSLDLIKLQLDNKKCEYGIDFDTDKLARYLLFERGCIKGVYNYPVYLDDKLSLPNKIYNYVCPCDVSHFRMRFVSPSYCGNSKHYYPVELAYDVGQFIKDWVYFDDYMEKILDKLYYLDYEKGLHRQQVDDYMQELKQKITCARV